MFNSCQVLIVSSDPLQCEKTEEIVRRLGLQAIRCASLTDATPSYGRANISTRIVR